MQLIINEAKAKSCAADSGLRNLPIRGAAGKGQICYKVDDSFWTLSGAGILRTDSWKSFPGRNDWSCNRAGALHTALVKCLAFLIAGYVGGKYRGAYLQEQKQKHEDSKSAHE